MPIQQFTAYDLIVDTLPGAVFLVCLIPIGPAELLPILSNTLTTTGVLVVALGYVVGRFIHTLSSDFSNRNLFDRSDASTGIKQLVTYELADRTAVTGETLAVDDFREARFEREEDSEELISYGQALLYPENTLYGKYEALSTFFRNLFYALAGIFIIYILRSIGGGLILAVNFHFTQFSAILSWEWYLPLSLLFLVCAWVSFRGWQTFEDRKSRAFIYDLHQFMDLHESNEIDWELPSEEPENN